MHSAISQGIVWLVDDNPDQRRRFRLSYASALRHCPHLPRRVFNAGASLNLGYEETALQPALPGAAGKFDAFSRSPFDRTLFLDNDTVVLRDPTGIIEATEYVSALPYPDFYSEMELRETRSAQLPAAWRNANSGVVVFSREFLQHYGGIWRRYGHLADRLIGYDQCLFSLALHTAPARWSPRLDLQVTTTPYALDFLLALRNAAPDPPLLGGVPLAVLMSVAVLHYTAHKQRYEDLLSSCGLEAQMAATRVMSLEDLAAHPYPRLQVQITGHRRADGFQP
jgi:hypothetical protein